MILCRDIVEVLWTAGAIMLVFIDCKDFDVFYYFSTQGCMRVFSFVGAFAEEPLVVAASLRALISKKPAMMFTL